jgi:hypothetical protein
MKVQSKAGEPRLEIGKELLCVVPVLEAPTIVLANICRSPGAPVHSISNGACTAANTCAESRLSRCSNGRRNLVVGRVISAQDHHCADRNQVQKPRGACKREG